MSVSIGINSICQAQQAIKMREDKFRIPVQWRLFYTCFPGESIARNAATGSVADEIDRQVGP
jgi:hypothetical protein